MPKDYQNSSKEKLLAEIARLKKEIKKKKKYGLVWEDKPEDVVEQCKTELPVLKEVKNKEVATDPSKPVNILIEGDNYHALSVLNYTHAKKVDVIYIDPPYNTGNKDFIYNDQYVDREDGYRHSKWLSFMEKRLKLAKALLKETGVIFISIDDNEVAQLRMLMDNPDLFGEENFITTFIWRRTKTPPRLSKNVARVHDYLLCYAKNSEKLQLNKLLLKQEYVDKVYRNPDNDSRGFWRSVPLLQPDSSSNKIRAFKMPDGRIIEGKWRCSEETLQQYIKDKILIVSKDGTPHRKLFLSESNGQIPDTWLSDIATNENASKEIENIFGSNSYFNSPKPTALIKYILSISTSVNSLVVDFFAGSGTTGDAVLQLNKEDGGNRSFILCTDNQDNNGSGLKIATDICYPRVKKVIEGYKNAKGEKVKGLGGNLKYFKTSFVSVEPSDKNRKKLTEEVVEMLCVKEGAFEAVLDKPTYKIFKNHNHYCGIVLDQSAISNFKKDIKDIKGKCNAYIFSLTDESFDDIFVGLKNKVKVSPIPEAILRVYRRIFK